MKNRLLNVVYVLFIISALIWFYFINQLNYEKTKQISAQFIAHPEMLPNKDTAKYTSFGFSNLRADIYWLETIQYIGGYAIGSEYKKYLFSILDLITELNPYFEKPYLIGQLLLPNYNERYEKLSKEEQDLNTKQAERIGAKGIENFCDMKKVQAIMDEGDLQKVWTDPKYKNPCKKSDIIYSQAFIYYFYLKNPKMAADYYKVASANDDALEWAKIMAAIMSGKGWDREKSIMMFLTLAKSSDEKENEKCQFFSKELQKVTYAIYRENLELTGDMIKQMQNLRNEYFKFDDKAEQEIIKGDNCNNYINKAIRELNLQYIENGNKKYNDETGQNALSAKILYDLKYIDFLPTDFQQYEDHGIIYTFNMETKHFDYEMWNY